MIYDWKLSKIFGEFQGNKVFKYFKGECQLSTSRIWQSWSWIAPSPPEERSRIERIFPQRRKSWTKRELGRISRSFYVTCLMTSCELKSPLFLGSEFSLSLSSDLASGTTVDGFQTEGVFNWPILSKICSNYREDCWSTQSTLKKLNVVRTYLELWCANEIAIRFFHFSSILCVSKIMNA
jgi:hypothetical protein